MNINDQINAMTKPQAEYVMAVAKKRIEELDKEKNEAIKMFEEAFHARKTVRIYGQDLHVISYCLNSVTYGMSYYEIELEGGSNIIIMLD